MRVRCFGIVRGSENVAIVEQPMRLDYDVVGQLTSRDRAFSTPLQTI